MFEHIGKYINTNELVKSKRDITHIVIHCSATIQGRHFDVHDIHGWHKAPPRNWKGVGYHYILGVGGNIEIGRDIDFNGAHVKGKNVNTIGICLIGGLGEDGKPKENSFTKDQYLVLDDFIRKLMCMYPKAKVLGHRDFGGVKKSCPCFEVSDFIKDMKC